MKLLFFIDGWLHSLRKTRQFTNAQYRISKRRDQSQKMVPEEVSFFQSLEVDARHFEIVDDSFQNGLSRGTVEFDRDKLVFKGRINPTNFHQNFEAPTVQYVNKVK